MSEIIAAQICVLIQSNFKKYISVENDIALIKMDKPVKFSKYIQPACLGIHEPKENVKVFVSGWGITEKHTKSDILNGVRVTTYSLEKCKKMYQIPDPVEGLTSNITNRMICTLDSAKDACQGDSGGMHQQSWYFSVQLVAIAL